MKVFIYDNGYNLNNYIKILNALNIETVISNHPNKSDDCNALLLTGGGDICPAFYGVRPDVYDLYDSITDISETYLIKNFILKNKKILGICKGLQVINVFFGGTLKTIDKPEILNHYSFNKDLFHEIVDANGNRYTVNSMHKQQIDKLGVGLKVNAVSKNGIIEAISHEKYDVFAVQFHPERLSFNDAIKFYKKFLLN
ncbi:MAG: gamma-glutamyl-gamma-aminobutyrate hydrolase family protein [Clostridia bacterium]|nr:gamma-glutamyl-gamma-aminobutyrate hydrolase family protein [Clostridia bacterium]